DADVGQPRVAPGHADPVVDRMSGALVARQLADVPLDVRWDLAGSRFRPSPLDRGSRRRKISASSTDLVPILVQAHLDPMELAVRWCRRPVTQQVIGTRIAHHLRELKLR